jgi:hypothetical protein
MTLAMVKKIDPKTRKIDNILEVNKVSLMVRVANVEIKLGGKLEVQVEDDSEECKTVVHVFRPKYAPEEDDLNSEDVYKFICNVRYDHGEIVLHCYKYSKVTKEQEISYHSKLIQSTELFRQQIWNRYKQMNQNKEIVI